MTAPTHPEENAPIETERLRLEPLVATHAVEMLHALASPEIYRFIPNEPPTDVVALAARYARLATRRSPDGRECWLNWAVRLRSTGECIGRVEATVREASQAEIAYLIAPDSQGKGLATEACRAMIAWIADAHGVRTFEATIDTRNARSIAMVTRIGFAWVRTVRDADVIRGESSDEAVYRWKVGPLIP